MTDHDPLDELIGDLRTDVPELSDEVLDARWAQLQAVIEPVLVTTEPTPDPVVVPLPTKRLLRSPPGRPRAPTVLSPAASAAATLNSAADNINPVDEPIAPGQYRYFTSHSWQMISHTSVGTDPGQFDVQYEFKAQDWVPADLAQPCTVRTNRTGERKWVTGDEERAKAAGIELLGPETKEESRSCTDGGEWSHYPSAEFLASLPRDPQQLYDLLRHMPIPVAISEKEWVLNRVTTTLVSGRASAELRAALYRALALLPGLEVTEQVANLDGHQGTALGYTEHGVRNDLIIDPATGQFIGERRVIESGHPDLPPDTVFSYTSVSNPVIVDGVGETR